MSFKKIILFFPLFFFSCLYDYELVPLEKYYIFHDNSSKVWLVDNIYQSNFDITPKNIQDKEVIVFHQNKKCYFYLLKNFSKGAYSICDFKLDEVEKKIIFTNKEKSDTFSIQSYSDNKIVLVNENNDIKKILISFPEY